MNKTELIDAVSSTVNLPKTVATRVFDAIIDNITQALMCGNDVVITGFGSFSVRNRLSREGRNPKTGEKIFINASNTVAFKIGKSLKESVNEK